MSIFNMLQRASDVHFNKKVSSMSSNNVQDAIDETMAAAAAAAAHFNSSDILPVKYGGTGRKTLTSGYFLRGNGTSTVTQTAPASVRSAIGVTEGTWTPAFHGGGTTTDTAYGHYIKSGNRVIVSFFVNAVGTMSGSQSSYLYLDGLPYAPDFTDVTWYAGGGFLQGVQCVLSTSSFSGYVISNNSGARIYPRASIPGTSASNSDYFARLPKDSANVYMAGTIMYYTAG